MLINIITRCSRPYNLLKVAESVFRDIPQDISINWHVVFDTKKLKDIDAELLSYLDSKNVNLHFKEGDGWGLKNLNKIIQSLHGWIYHCDDDNIIHPKFYQKILDFIKHNKHKKALIFSQQVSGKDFTGLQIRLAKPENVKVKRIDLAQWIIHSDLHKGREYGSGYLADGEFIESLYQDFPEDFEFIDDIICYYNFLEKISTPKLPRILYIGEDTPILKTTQSSIHESSNLSVKYVKDDLNIVDNIIKFNPDAIISKFKEWSSLEKLSSLPLNFRKRWLNIADNKESIGDVAYSVSMNSILNKDTLEDSNLISFFTPIYNTGESLWKTYESVAKQTYQNWEWILINDSSDGGKTLKIAEEIAANDPRVKLYDFREKSRGCIGEVKYRACSMASGYMLVELDHDDILVEDIAKHIHNAAQKYPNCGMFYGDTLELLENGESNVYGEGWGCGYGSYRSEIIDGKEFKIANTPNINPVTIRHIVGIPNHVRAFRRSTYFEVGGHNRRLTVADDYELVIRMFLKTKICKIPKTSYIQNLYSNTNSRNTHDLSRADIQRRVKTISNYYHKQISNRFKELGVEDYVYSHNPNFIDWENMPPFRFGNDECKVNEIYNI